MIWYVVTKQHAYTLRAYLKTWGKPLAGRFCELTYDDLLRTREFKAFPGTYIFSDIERLYPPHAHYAAVIRQKILEQQPEARVFNHPTQSMRRYELLRTLFERGDNAFNGFVRLTGRELVGRGGQDSQAASWRHSARAAERFCLKMSRRLRWRSWLKWL